MNRNLFVVTAAALITGVTPVSARKSPTLSDDIKSLASNLRDDYQGDCSEVFTLCSRILAEGDATVAGDVFALADAVGKVAETRWANSAADDSSDATVQCLHCYWMLQPDDLVKTLDQLLDKWTDRPVLAGAALQILARSPRPEENDRLNALVNDMQARFESAKSIISVVDIASKGAAEHGAVCKLLESFNALDNNTGARLLWLVRQSATGGDWVDSKTVSQLPSEMRILSSGVHVFDQARDRCDPSVYWARSRIKSLSQSDPNGVGVALATLTLTAPFKRLTGDKVSSVSALYTARAAEILVARWLSSDAKAAYSQTKGK